MLRFKRLLRDAMAFVFVLFFAFAAIPAHAQEQEPPSLPDLVAQAVGTANAAGFNPIQLDPETRAAASVGGQIVTSFAAGLGCPETAKAVGKWFKVGILIVE